MMHLVSCQLLEQRETRLEEVFHVVFQRSILSTGFQIRHHMFMLRATKEDSDGTWVADQQFLPNEVLPAAYASAGIVLNDHWPDMASEGFLSNRLFDAAACAARVLTDQATGLDEVFGDVVRTYDGPTELVDVLRADRASAFADRAARLDLATRVARDHGFDARATVLIERAQELRRRR